MNFGAVFSEVERTRRRSGSKARVGIVVREWVLRSDGFKIFLEKLLKLLSTILDLTLRYCEMFYRVTCKSFKFRPGLLNTIAV